jgi:DNA mismatch endonuclease (patch repair protein)
MSDIFSTEKRSMIMKLIRNKNTKAEIKFRRILFSLGYRFRLHDKSLPGCPDVILPKYSTVIQIRGCFWHQHNCRDGHVPKSRIQFWKSKLEANRLRDQRNDRKLRSLGWSVIVVWECKLRSKEKLNIEVRRVIRILSN